MNTSTVPNIRDLYPNLSEQEFAAAEDKLDRYLSLVLRIFERMQLDTYPQGGGPDLGASLSGRTVKSLNKIDGSITITDTRCPLWPHT